METLRFEEQHRIPLLLTIIAVLKQGGTVVVPTDTVYGIIADALNPVAVEKVFAIKGRSREKALSVFVRDITTARRLAYIADAKARVLEHVWPGQMIIVFHHKGKFSDILTGGLNTIGMRIPDHPFLLELLWRFENPLVQTSANRAGSPPARNVGEIEHYFKGRSVTPDLVIDGGDLIGKPSTVVDFTGNQPLLLRIGMMTKGEFGKFLAL